MRKGLLVLCVLLLAASLLFAGGQADQDKTKQRAATTQAKEAPMLAAQVSAGKLPPVEQRLPENPFVIAPVEKIGEYGGTWRMLFSGQTYEKLTNFTMPALTQWDQKQEKIIPYLAESYSSNPDATEWTFKLRKGAKWSDGTPLTADDYVFFYNDITFYKDYSPVPNKAFVTTAGYGKIVKINDYEFKYVFPAPNPLFDIWATKYDVLHAPAHYLKQFHPKYTDIDKLNETAKKEGFADWRALLDFKRSPADPGTPRMDAWLPTVKPPQTKYIFVRNPYFWAVDTEGNQLPYIDKMEFIDTQMDMLPMKILAGEPNFQATQQETMKNLPIYKQAQADHGYELLEWDQLETSEVSLQLNLNTADPVLQKIFRDRNFRIALSHAIDREAINKTLYFGLLKPVQATLNRIDSDVFKEEYINAYIEYDPAKSNKLLDAMGLTQRDKEGFRLKPDGKRLSIVAEFPTNWATIGDQFQMIRDDYRKIGIDFIPKGLEPSIYWQRNATDQTEAVGWPYGKTKTDTGIVPTGRDVKYAPLWGLWYASNGKDGLKPDDPLQIELMDAWTRIMTEPDPAERTKLFDFILKAQAENLWIIGTVGPTKKIVLKMPWFHNVPRNYYFSYHHGRNQAASYPMQFWIEKAHQND